MSANTQITIGGVDYTAYCDIESVQVDNNVVMTSDTMTVDVILRGELARPADGQEIVWLNNGVREFGGVVSQVQEVDIGTDLVYTVTAQSYERWLNRHLAIYYYSQQSADATVIDLVSRFTTGFTTNNVQAGFTIPPQYFNYVKVSDAIKKVAEQIEYGWYVDYYKDVHFYPIESFVSPLPNNTLDCDADVTNYSNLQLTEDGTQKKTRIYLKGFKSRVSTPVTLTFVADGQTMQWSLGYRPSRAQGDFTAKVGGNPITVKRDLVEGFPGQNTTDTSSMYLNYNQLLIRLNYAPAQGTLIQCTMYYLTDQVVMREDPQAQSVAAQADGNGDGRYEFAVTEPSLSQATIDAANARGDMLLYKYSNPNMSGEFTSFTQGWRAGQYFYIQSNRRMGGINMKMFVQEVQKKIVKADGGGLVLQYDITISNTPYLSV